jgi:ferredoxin
MKIQVNFDKCALNARCMKACPQVFEVREDGFLYILQEEPPESLRQSVEQAMSDCPTGAISLEG